MIKPRKKYILVEPIKEDVKETKTGLIIPSNIEQEQKAIAKVIATGDEISDIKKGDKIIHGTYAGERIKTHEKGMEKDYILLFDDDIIAFYEV